MVLIHLGAALGMHFEKVSARCPENITSAFLMFSLKLSRSKCGKEHHKDHDTADADTAAVWPCEHIQQSPVTKSGW